MEKGDDIYIINLVEVYKRIKARRKFIFKVIMLFLCIGLFLYFYKQNKEYTVSGKMIAKVQSVDSSANGDMSGLIWEYDGFKNIFVDVTLYQKLVYSAPFMRELLTVEIEPSDKVILANYLIRKNTNFRTFVNKYTINLFQTLFGKEPLDISYKAADSLDFSRGNLSVDENAFAAILKKQIIFTTDDNMPVITVTASDPKLAVTMLREVQRLFSKYASEFWTLMQKTTLAELQKCYEEAMESFTQKQLRIEELKKNKEMGDMILEFQKKKLDNECQLLLAYSSELQDKISRIRMILENERPLFVAENSQIQIPVEPSNRQSSLSSVIIISILFGGFIGINMIFILPIIAYITDVSWLRSWKRSN